MGFTDIISAPFNYVASGGSFTHTNAPDVVPNDIAGGIVHLQPLPYTGPNTFARLDALAHVKDPFYDYKPESQKKKPTGDDNTLIYIGVAAVAVVLILKSR